MVLHTSVPGTDSIYALQIVAAPGAEYSEVAITQTFSSFHISKFMIIGSKFSNVSVFLCILLLAEVIV